MPGTPGFDDPFQNPGWTTQLIYPIGEVVAAGDFKTSPSLAGMVLYSNQLASGDNTVYTVPASSATQIATMVLCNTSGTAVTLSVSVVPNGGTLSTIHKVVDTYSLAAHDSTKIVELEGSVLDTGAFISVNSSAATAVDCVLTGYVAS